MADTRDLKSLAKYLACGFESRSWHRKNAVFYQVFTVSRLNIVKYSAFFAFVRFRPFSLNNPCGCQVL